MENIKEKLSEVIDNLSIRRTNSVRAEKTSSYIVGYKDLGDNYISLRIREYDEYYSFSIEVNDKNTFNSKCNKDDIDKGVETFIKIINHIISHYEKLEKWEETFPRLTKKEERNDTIDRLINIDDYRNIYIGDRIARQREEERERRRYERYSNDDYNQRQYGYYDRMR